MHTVKCFLSRFTMYVENTTSLKNFSEGGKKSCLVDLLWNEGECGIVERPDPSATTGRQRKITVRHSKQRAQHLPWRAARKARPRAGAGCWAHVLSPFPLRQHHLQRQPKLKGTFNITVLSYNRPDCLESLVQFKMLFVHLDTLFPHILLHRSSPSQPHPKPGT